MRKIWLIAWREYSEAVKSKGFLVGIALAPLLMFGSILGMAVLGDKVDTADQRFVVIDHTGKLEAQLMAAAERHNNLEVRDKAGKQVRPRYVLDVVPAQKDADAQRVRLSDDVRGERLHAFVDIGAEAITGDSGANYYSERAAMDDARTWFQSAVNEAVRNERMQAAGIEREQMDRVMTPVQVEGKGLLSVDQATGKVTGGKKRGEGEAFFAPFVLMMLLYMLVMFGAMPQIHAVMEEKTQRIAEVLLSSTSPFHLMAGKLLGNLGLALTTGIVYIGGGLIALFRAGAQDAIQMHLLGWFFAYLVLAVAMYGAAAIAVGAAVNDAKEAQSLTMPVLLPLIVPMFILVPAIKEPNGMLATAISLFPPCTPLMMLLRQASPGGVPAWQPWVGLAGLIACTVLYVWAAGRVFRVGLLAQGKSPKFGELVRWAIKG